MVKRTALVVTFALAMGSLPMIATSVDCSKWLAQYRAALQRARAHHALRHIKHDLVAHRHPHRLSPLAALRKFQVDCGPDLTIEARLTPLPYLPPLTPVVPYVDYGLPELPPLPKLPLIAVLAWDTPDAGDTPDVPVALPVSVPILAPVPVSVPVAVTPEPTSWLLVMTGLACMPLRKRFAA